MRRRASFTRRRFVQGGRSGTMASAKDVSVASAPLNVADVLPILLIFARPVLARTRCCQVPKSIPK